MTATWEARVADLWKIIDDCQPEAFVAQMRSHDMPETS
jgi:hypothetical protein